VEDAHNALPSRVDAHQCKELFAPLIGTSQPELSAFHVEPHTGPRNVGLVLPDKIVHFGVLEPVANFAMDFTNAGLKVKNNRPILDRLDIGVERLPFVGYKAHGRGSGEFRGHLLGAIADERVSARPP
jgi:hypothetical protein